MWRSPTKESQSYSEGDTKGFLHTPGETERLHEGPCGDNEQSEPGGEDKIINLHVGDRAVVACGEVRLQH